MLGDPPASVAQFGQSLSGCSLHPTPHPRILQQASSPGSLLDSLRLLVRQFSSASPSLSLFSFVVH